MEMAIDKGIMMEMMTDDDGDLYSSFLLSI